jgi:hypothetical protein
MWDAACGGSVKRPIPGSTGPWARPTHFRSGSRSSNVAPSLESATDRSPFSRRAMPRAIPQLGHSALHGPRKHDQREEREDNESRGEAPEHGPRSGRHASWWSSVHPACLSGCNVTVRVFWTAAGRPRPTDAGASVNARSLRENRPAALRVVASNCYVRRTAHELRTRFRNVWRHNETPGMERTGSRPSIRVRPTGTWRPA